MTANELFANLIKTGFRDRFRNSQQYKLSQVLHNDPTVEFRDGGEFCQIKIEITRRGPNISFAMFERGDWRAIDEVPFKTSAGCLDIVNHCFAKWFE